MRIQDSRYLKVWKVNNNNGNITYNLGDSKKMQDGTYKNWTWFFCRPVGDAKNIQLNEGDTITIKSGVIEMYEKDGTWRPSVTIFDMERTATGNPQGNTGGYNSSARDVNEDYNPNNDPRHNGRDSYENYPSGNNFGNIEDDIPF